MILPLLEELLRCPSITPADAGCQEIVAQRLEGSGFQVERLQFGEVKNLWATHGSGSPLICLAGHTDVVPPGPLESWTSPPFEPTIRDGKLYARGASDMKASDAAMVVALEKLAQEGHPGTIALLLAGDEEGLGTDGTERVLRHVLNQGIAIDAAIVGEPTSESQFGDVIKNGRRGSTTGTITVSGVQGHTAYPQLANNAIHRVAPILAELTSLDWGDGGPDFPPTTLQVSNIRAGTGANNVIPGSCYVQFNVRFGTSHTADGIRERVEAVFTSLGVTDSIDWSVSALPFLTTQDPLVTALSAAIHGVTGVEPRLSTGGGTSDARFFAVFGIPVAEFGPLNASIHAIDENVEISCLEPLVEVYKQAVRRLLIV